MIRYALVEAVAVAVDEDVVLERPVRLRGTPAAISAEPTSSGV